MSAYEAETGRSLVFPLSAVAPYVAYTAAALGCLIAVPQIARLVRTREIAGISAGSWEVNTLSAVAWLAYGMRTLQGAQVIANACSLLGGVAVLWLLVGPGGGPRSPPGPVRPPRAPRSGAGLPLPVGRRCPPPAAPRG